MNPDGESLLIRADANAQMGTGHLMRCLALAQAWQARGGSAVFVTACDSDELLDRLRGEGFQVVELQKHHREHEEWETVWQVLAAHPRSWVVLDGYHFDPSYQRRVKEAGHPLLVIDDMAHLEHYYADIVLNQNIHAEQLHYSCEPDTQLLLGTDYVLLRREFWPWRGWRREIPEVARKVLVTLGGGDVSNQTLKVVRTLQRMDVDGLEAMVVAGASYPHFEELQAAAAMLQDACRVVRNTKDMAALIASADVAVSAAGSTCWELAFLGLPGLLLALAENQQGAARGLSQAGVFQTLGKAADVRVSRVRESLVALVGSVEARLQMSRSGQSLVDGRGTERVVRLLRDGRGLEEV